ncbi:CidA/LrgA family protein [Ottowia sp.]|uniref:CidA/LrgA family protein n=1 Tax=Ottowia sp. TaxID=1898956 RepID=UPI0026219D58|nr:CidA/LrgA family protein [Ottowia sp.]
MHKHRFLLWVSRHPMLQLGLMLVFWLAGEGLVRALSLPVPGGLVGLAAVLLLLATRRLSATGLRRGAQWLLADMLLFFVPAVLAVLDHREFLGLMGLKILCVIVLSTALVMVVTATVVDACCRWRERHAVAEPALR